jgi:hypothetical protein
MTFAEKTSVSPEKSKAEIEGLLRKYTRAGKRMPLDTDERSDGNVVIEADGKARVLPAGDPYTGPRFASHFSSCPDAPAWRKRA